jgi:hypothetical protein
MKTIIGTGLVILCILGTAGCGGPRNPEAEQAARKSAGGWLDLLDSGRFDESWEKSAPVFQNAVSREDWKKNMNALRKPFGKLLSRKCVKARYRTTLPGAPDGEYVVLQYKSAFENKKNAIETVTPAKTEDGGWRVSGYYIR